MNALLVKNLNLVCLRSSWGNVNTGLILGAPPPLQQHQHQQQQNRQFSVSFSNQHQQLMSPTAADEQKKLIDNEKKVKKYLDKKSLKHYDGWNSLLINDYCSKMVKNADIGVDLNTNMIHMNKQNGDFYCLKCNSSGDFDRFQKLIESNSLCGSLNGSNRSSICSSNQTQSSGEEEETEINKKNKENHDRLVSRKYLNEWLNGKSVRFISQQEFKIILKNSNINFNISKNLLEKFGVKVFEKRLLFPVYDYSKVANNQTLLNIVNLSDEDCLKSQDESNFAELKSEQCEIESLKLIYGIESMMMRKNATAPNSKKYLNVDSGKRLFITDNLVDLIILSDLISDAVICVKSVEALKSGGEGGRGGADFMTFALMEKYDQIIFWQKNKKLSYDLANCLNINRCYLINYSRSPYECLSKYESVEKIIRNEIFSMKLSFVKKFEDFKRSVYEEIAFKDKFAGIKWDRFQQLNKLLKGHREGELTVFTGTTGCGKTTFLSEYSLDLTMKGVKTLWGSFEIKNKRLIKIMMKQYARVNLEENLNLFDSVAQKFSQLPIYFMNFHGEETIENVIRTMSNSVLMYDIKHVVIDNLQFMLGTQFLNGMDKFSQQDMIISKFRQFATNFNCHVTLVIHPRKEEDNEPLRINSIFGSAKSTQEADNVLIMQSLVKEIDSKAYRVKYVEVCKNRFDGELGKLFLKFNKDTLNFQASMPQSHSKSSSQSNDRAGNAPRQSEVADFDFSDFTN